jgi:hypothetical protein
MTWYLYRIIEKSEGNRNRHLLLFQTTDTNLIPDQTTEKVCLKQPRYNIGLEKTNSGAYIATARNHVYIYQFHRRCFGIS